MNKKIRSNLYMNSKIVFSKTGLIVESDPQGYLFSGGKYKTKILQEDLPEWFVYGYIHKQYGYISAKDVKHLLYVPNYSFDNHLHKDDSLFISYSAEIEPYRIEDVGNGYKGYDIVISGSLIIDFVNAAKKYSEYDVMEIQKLIELKEAWYYEQNPI